MATQFDAQFPDVAETLERMEADATVEHVTTAQEPSALAILLFQAACWIVAVAVFFLLFCGIKALWDGFLFGA